MQLFFGVCLAGFLFLDTIPLVGAQADVRIAEIQGPDHKSPLIGEQVATTGVVTATAENGFYFQDPHGDSNPNSSEGLFVFTGHKPGVARGDAVRVAGWVAEYASAKRPSDLTVTQLQDVTYEVLTSGNALPAVTVVGRDGRLPPKDIVDNDGFGIFDPKEDGIDFYESLEGMLVRINEPRVVGCTDRYGQMYVLGDDADEVTLSERGVLLLEPNNLHPQCIQLNRFNVDLPIANVGDKLSDAVGVYSYSFGEYEVLLTEELSLIQGGLEPDISELKGGPGYLTIGSYNVLNLDPDPSDGSDDRGQGQFAAIARHIVLNLQSPDIIGLQEIQDNSGQNDDGVTSADITGQVLIAAIMSAGGPQYTFVDVDPVDGADGGARGGNIRVAYLYNPTRVGLVGSLRRLDEDGIAFTNGVRKSLVARFCFNAREIILVNNHFSSKYGSPPIFGNVQPPVNANIESRLRQATFVNNYVSDVLDQDPRALLIVLGDINELPFSIALMQPPSGNVLQNLMAGSPPVLIDLARQLPAEQRYSYNFRGNAQQLDYMLGSPGLLALMPSFEIVHINTDFAVQASDHDPLLARIPVAPPTSVVIKKRDGCSETTGEFRPGSESPQPF